MARPTWRPIARLPSSTKMIIIVCGVAGCGKTTVGKALAQRLGLEFADADDFHTEENKALMRSGVGLNDALRHGWLVRLRELCQAWTESERGGGVLACSALRASYRHFLASNVDYAKSDEENGRQVRRLDVKFLLLDCAEELIRDRLAARQGHYFNPSLVQAQFSTLERPAEEARLDEAVLEARGIKAYSERRTNLADVAFHHVLVVACTAESTAEQLTELVVSSLQPIRSLAN